MLGTRDPTAEKWHACVLIPVVVLLAEGTVGHCICPNLQWAKAGK